MINFLIVFHFRELGLLLIFMLPKLEEKSQVRDSGPYRAFAMDFLGPSQCDNNISKLKRLREFLDDESIENHKK